MKSTAAFRARCFSRGSCLMRGRDSTRQPSDLTVHEWGTFTSVAGEDGSAIDWDALGGKNDLPGFVNSFGYRCLNGDSRIPCAWKRR